MKFAKFLRSLISKNICKRMLLENVISTRVGVHFIEDLAKNNLIFMAYDYFNLFEQNVTSLWCKLVKTIFYESVYFFVTDCVRVY